MRASGLIAMESLFYSNFPKPRADVHGVSVAQVFFIDYRVPNERMTMLMEDLHVKMHTHTHTHSPLS